MLSVNTFVVASSLFALSTAFERLTVPTHIAADTHFNLTILNDLNGGLEDSASHGSFDAKFANFRVYLSTTPPGWGSGPVCYLKNSTAIHETSVTLNIPASVGPSEKEGYSLSVMEFNPPGEDGPSGFQYSNEFEFTKGTGHWSDYETSGSVIGDADNIPCTAYGCARNCSQTFYPANSANITDDSTKAQVSAADAADKSTYECIAACPGVTYASWDDDGSDDSSPTAGGSASTTESSSPTNSPSTTASRPNSATTGSPNSASPTSSSTSSASTPSSSSSDSNINSATVGWVFFGALAQLVWAY